MKMARVFNPSLIKSDFLNTILGVVIIVFFIIGLSLLSINKFAPQYMNTDTVLFSVMSVQNVTPFIWGQDRLANFIPFAFSWIKNPPLNLFFHLFVFSVSFYGFILLLSYVIVKLSEQVTISKIIVAFIISVLVSLLLLYPFASHVFIIEGQPYALSYLFILGAFILFVKNNNSLFTKSACVLFVFLSMGLNPSILLVGTALSFGYIVVERNFRGFYFAAISIAAFIIWAYLSKKYGFSQGGTYSSFASHDLLENTVHACANVIAQIRVEGMILLSMVIMGNYMFRSHIHTKNIVHKYLVMTWAFSILWIFVFSQNKWIIANTTHFRYFFPIYIVIIFHASLLSYNYLSSCSYRIKIWFVIISAVLIAWYLVEPIVSRAEYRVFKNVSQELDFAREKELRFVAGDYWKGWALVFELNTTDVSSYGFLYRAIGNKQNLLNAIDKDLSRYGEIQIMCVSSTPEQCLVQVEQITGRKWQFSESVCNGDCKHMSLKPF